MAFKDNFKEFNSIPVNNCILLRQVKPEQDFEAYYKIYSDAEAFKYYEGYDNPPENRDRMMLILENQIKAFKSGREYTWTIVHIPTDTAIGRIHFSSYQNNNTAANVGYFLSRDYWGNGIATACVKSVVEFGFNALKLERIYTTVSVDNAASIRVLEKNGFIQEGKLRHCFKIEQTYCDCFMYSKLYSDGAL